MKMLRIPHTAYRLPFRFEGQLVGPGADGANASMHGVKGDGRAPGGPGMGQARNEAASVRDEVVISVDFGWQSNGILFPKYAACARPTRGG